MPYTPRLPFPNTPPRTKLCVVNTHGDGVTDDSFSILYALWDCNDGGHVLFPRGETYTIGTAMDLTFLKHIDIGLVSRFYSPRFESAVGPCRTGNFSLIID